MHVGLTLTPLSSIACVAVADSKLVIGFVFVHDVNAAQHKRTCIRYPFTITMQSNSWVSGNMLTWVCFTSPDAKGWPHSSDGDRLSKWADLRCGPKCHLADDNDMLWVDATLTLAPCSGAVCQCVCCAASTPP